MFILKNIKERYRASYKIYLLNIRDMDANKKTRKEHWGRGLSVCFIEH